MSNIYGLTTEMLDLERLLMNSLDEETGEVDTVISNALDVKREEFESKALGVATLYRRFNNMSAEIKAEINRLKELLTRTERVEDRLENSLSEACQRLGYTKIDGVRANISFRTSEQTIIDDVDQLPEEFKKVKIDIQPDKTKIKNGIKLGMNIPGAHVEQVKHIQIK